MHVHISYLCIYSFTIPGKARSGTRLRQNVLDKQWPAAVSFSQTTTWTLLYAIITGLCFNGWERKNNFNHFSQQFKVSTSCSCEIISAGCWSGSGVKSGGLYFCSFFLVINDLFMDVYIDWLLFWWRRAVKYRIVFTSGPGWTDYLW